MHNISGAGTPIRPCAPFRPRHQNDIFPYSCLLLTQWQRQEALTFAAANLGSSCEALASHWDYQLVKYLPHSVRPQTLLITSLRHPVDRFIR